MTRKPVVYVFGIKDGKRAGGLQDLAEAEFLSVG
jgi:hypothetical protein